jgi:hypothetical protein
MLMGSGWYRCAGGAPWVDSLRRRIGVIATALFGLCAAACTTNDGLTTGSIATPRVSVAFERIDGPPEGVFRKLVQNLSEEAEVRQIAVVSRETSARYRIRGYMAAHVRRGRTTIAWIWDVYDADQNRALRISGEEDAGRAGKDAWAETDDQVLRRISHAGMDRLVSFLEAPSQEASIPPQTTTERVFTVAGAGDDFTPESAGIFRVPGGSEDTQPEPADAPAPKRRSAAASAVAAISH